MSPLGKLTLALIGLRLFGLNGLLVGLFLGHMLIDKTYVIRNIEKQINHLDDIIRIKLPYKYYKYYNRLDGNIWGKIWFGLLGLILFGLIGFILLFIAGQFIFDMPKNSKLRKIKKKTDHFFDNNWGKILGGIVGFLLKSPILIFVGIILGFIADYRRLEGAKLMPFNMLRNYWQKINPLKLWRDAQVGEHRRYLEIMAALAALIVEADGKINDKERKKFCQVFAVKPEQKSFVYEIFENKQKHKFSLEKYADMLESLTRNNENLKDVSIENLFKIASADEVIGEAEMRMLKKVAKIIGLDDRSFARLKKEFKPNPISKKLMGFYDVLGLSYDADMEEIKARWKKLIVIYHPDKLTNASEKEIKIATKRMAEINLAYQEIVKAKGKK
ncbi:MAG: hypothetical protein E7004_02190 [Alphaproteobacteria bacterium]|nr:hypothetical protein [Alphaproteobacteria bacterium]MBE6467387.1 hypothetical protein [Alphaproteobacteria bacterium]